MTFNRPNQRGHPHCQKLPHHSEASERDGGCVNMNRELTVTTIDIALQAIEEKIKNGDYKKMMADDRSFVGLAIEELSKIRFHMEQAKKTKAIVEIE